MKSLGLLDGEERTRGIGEGQVAWTSVPVRGVGSGVATVQGGIEPCRLVAHDKGVARHTRPRGIMQVLPECRITAARCDDASCFSLRFFTVGGIERRIIEVDDLAWIGGEAFFQEGVEITPRQLREGGEGFQIAREEREKLRLGREVGGADQKGWDNLPGSIRPIALFQSHQTRRVIRGPDS